MDIPWNVPLSHGTVGSNGQSHCPMGPWDRMDSRTYIHLQSDRWTSHGMSNCPNGLWDGTKNYSISGHLCRKYEGEGKNGMIKIVLISGWNRTKKEGESRKKGKTFHKA